MTTLAIISGLSALWIGAAVAAAALPIMAHLLSRRGGPTLEFPAVRFVRIAAAEQATRDRPRDLLLLLLRILIVALIALAFDRPVWSSTAAPGTDAGAPEDVVIILDASASMTRTDATRGRPLFEIARDRALDELAAANANNSRAAVILATLHPEALLPRLTDQHDALAARLRDAEATLQRADMSAALTLAATLPAPDETLQRPRRIVVFSDMQASQWVDADAPVGMTLDLRVVGADAPTNNLAISEIEISPPRPVVGREATVSARLTNHAEAPARPTVTCAVRAHADEQWAEARSLTPNLAPGASTTISFPITFTRQGHNPVRLALIDNAFTHDDAAYLIAEVRAARTIALITSAPDTQRDGGAYFLEASLAPTPDAEFRVVRVAPAEATPEMLASFDAVVIAQAGALPDATIEALRETLLSEAGAGLFWVIDSQAAYESAASFNTPQLALPAVLTDRFTRLAADQRRTLAPTPLDNTPLRALEGPAARALLDASFTATAPAELAPSAVPLLTFDNAQPLIAWSSVATATQTRSRIITLHANLSADANSLVKGPMFPVLTHELMRFLLPASGGSTPAEIGEPLTTRIPASEPFTEPVTDASDQPARITRGGANFEPLLSARPAIAPGVTTFRDASARTIAYAAAVLAPSESDLRPLDEAAIAGLLERDADNLRIADASPDRTLTRRVIELWPWLLATAVAMLAFESFVAGFSRRTRTQEGA